MSIYNLLPSADISSKETLHAFWENGFSQDELSKITTIGDAKTLSDATVGLNDNGGILDVDIRRSRVSWMTYDDVPWLYDKLGFIARQLNGQYFQFDLTGFHEDLQYTTYQSSNEGFYDWHIDKGYVENGSPPRKLSMVVLLSKEDEYEGGDLELLTSREAVKLDKTQGVVHVFPSFVLHRVTPVTAGTRRSLVVWLVGPKFR